MAVQIYKAKFLPKALDMRFFLSSKTNKEERYRSQGQVAKETYLGVERLQNKQVPSQEKTAR